jgi:hypothetical protein
MHLGQARAGRDKEGHAVPLAGVEACGRQGGAVGRPGHNQE